MLTIVSLPKAFDGHISLIQSNAVTSWRRLDGVDIVLLGDDPGVAEFADAAGVRHEPKIARNEHGTPLLDSVLSTADAVASGDVLCYVNADILLMSDFGAAVNRIVGQPPRSFLMVGRRWDVDIHRPLEFLGDGHHEEARLRQLVASQGVLHRATGIDYFVYRRRFWRGVPPFAVGRTSWDQWLLYDARRRGTMLIDASPVVMAVHQNHEYVGGKQAIWSGPEAERNLELCGAIDHAFTIDDSTHRLTPSGLRSNVLRPPFRRRLEVWHLLRPRWRWLSAPLLALVRLSYSLRKRLGLAHLLESRRS